VTGSTELSFGSHKLGRFLDRLASTRSPVLIATDFDGTLTGVVPRPEGAQLDAATRAVLCRLARLKRVRLAVVTGRSLGDVSPRLEGIGPLWISAEHGAVLVDPHRRVHAAAQVVPDHRVGALRQRAAEIARLFAGAVVEVKQLGVALHFRTVDPTRHQALLEMFRLVCAIERAEILLGRLVVEGRFSSADKGIALARILGELPRDLAFVYAGDDLTDEPALSMASLAENGLGLYVRSKERPSPTTRVSGFLEGPAEWVHLLGLFADALEAEARRAS
jgi:trehalose 6-phosphate phosphatase